MDTNVYVVLLSSHTYIGRLIRTALKSKYNHAAISLDHDLKNMYSFARYNHNSPLVAGFVDEKLARYFHFGDPPIKIFKIKLTKREYKKVKREIRQFELNQKSYVYNFISAMIAPFKRRFFIKNSFTCIEFVVYILGRVNKVKNEADYYNFRKLDKELKNHVHYEGTLYDYVKRKDFDIGNYLEKKSKTEIFTGTFKEIQKLIIAILS